MEFPDAKYRKICSQATLQSSKQGFFNSFAEEVTECAGRDWLENVFQKQKSDLERVRACWGEEKIKKCLNRTLGNIQPVFRKKCVSAAHEARIEGEKMFKNGDIQKALALYSQSIVRSPKKDDDTNVDDGNTLSLGIIARAKCSMSQRRFEDCLRDLRLVLVEGCQEQNKHEIYSMMGWCYKCLQQNDKSKLAFNVAINLIEDRLKQLTTEGDQRKKKEKTKEQILLQKIKSEILKSQNADISEMIPNTDVLYTTGVTPTISGERNEKYDCASKSISFKYTKEAGRFGVATEHIDTGTCLIVEDPFAACLLPDMFASHCHHCFSRLQTAVPCKKCAGLAFCSIECRSIAMKTYHKYECPFMDLFIGSGMSILTHLAMRIVTREGLTFFKQLHSKLDPVTGTAKEELTSEQKQYVRLCSLVTLGHLRLTEDMFHRTLMAVFLTQCLKKAQFFNKDDNCTADEELITSIILRHLQFLQFNSHEVYETVTDDVDSSRGCKVVYIGVGIYQTTALLNHDCSPTILRYFHGKKIVIVNNKPLEAGDAVSENYGPIFTKRDLVTRARELTSRYWFKCVCDACAEDWPTFQTLTDKGFKLRCPTKKCQHLFQQPKSSKSCETSPQCPRCLNTVNLTAIMKRVSKLEKLFQKGIDYMDDNKCKKAAPLLTAYLDEIHLIASPPSRTIPLCQEALRTCLSLTGNLWIVKK